ncbi:hypothetical protein SCHIN_v1c07160 [Spiroplasma chinense]|uniref:Uncharacterized protein n=1 Tax=Spiroplasma chinense TaxID=216932 RepID=A0A5B9Y4E2_9MOLU|nr:hypothetical protein [Spiroplasma chinense]QEH61911.1 hypothetical protein SCHIN_v1c07160 [Spiroplasma chinense]
MKKLMGLLATISLTSSVTTSVVACGEPVVNEVETHVNNLKDMVSDIASESFSSPEHAIEVIKSKIASNSENGVFVGNEQPTKIHQVLFSDAFANENNNSVTIVYKISEINIADPSTFVWGKENNFTQSIKLKKPVIEVVSDLILEVGHEIEVNLKVSDAIDDNIQAIAKDTDLIDLTLENNKLTITGLKKGTTSITLKATGAQDRVFNVEVKDDVFPPFIKVDKLKNKTVVGFEEEFEVVVNNPTLATLYVSSSDTSVLTTTLTPITASKGRYILKLKTNKVGSANIKLTYSGAEDLEFKMNVVKVPTIGAIKDISILRGFSSEVNINLESEIDGELSANINEQDLANISLTDKVLKIDALELGTATITVQYSFAQSVTFKVEILEEPIIQPIQDQTLNIDQTIEVQANISNATEDLIGVEGYDNKIIKINLNNNKLIITGLMDGETNVTVTYKNAKSITFKVTVYKPVIKPIEDQRMAINHSANIEVIIENANDNNFEVKEFDENLISIIRNGNKLAIKGLAFGSTSVKISYKNAQSVVFEVYVEKPVIKPIENQLLNVDSISKIIVELEYENGSYITAKSENEDIVEVLVQGKEISLKGLKPGKTKIFVNYGDAPEISFIATVDKPIIQEIDDFELEVDKQVTIKTKVFNHSKAQLEFENENKDIIEVNLKGDDLTIIALKEGTSTITLKYEFADDVTFTVTVK